MTSEDQARSDAEDGDLIARWKAGDQTAATQLVGKHASALARFAASVGERDEIEELVQDTFVRAFNALDSFRAESSLRTWLFTIERRLILDRRRASKRRRNEVPIDERDAATEYDSLDGMIADETQIRLRQAMRHLSPMQRDVFTLRVGEGRSYKEIAHILDSTEGAARVHYHNAMRAVKELLDE